MELGWFLIGLAVGGIVMLCGMMLCGASSRGDDLLETRNSDFTENFK